MSGGAGIPNQPLGEVCVYDSVLRWTIPSRSQGGESHLVDLASYDGHGRCDCTDFQTRFEPLLKRLITPETAYHDGLVDKLRDYQLGPEDALSCWHVVQARRQCGRQVVRAFVAAQKAQNPPREG